MENSTFVASEFEKQQSDALKNTLRVYFNGDLEYNKRFSFFQYDFTKDQDMINILEALGGTYTVNDLDRLRYEIRLTAFNEENKLIFMYDARRKFTEYRQISLENYPVDLPVAYPVEMWIEKCREVKAHSTIALQNAIMASMIDIALSKSGYKVIRILYDTFDWTKSGAMDRLQKLIVNASKGTFDLS